MPCNTPLKAWYANGGGITFREENASSGTELQIPCSRCIGCRLDHARQWSLRCLFESREHKDNAFITLTYDQDNLPSWGNLEYIDYQLFMKRLRKEVKKPIKFFVAGEYGDDSNQPTGLGRPHWHALIFGYQFPDLVQHGTSVTGEPRYHSEQLMRLWGKGRVDVGDVTLRSAGYVARYATKKLNGQMAKDKYWKTDTYTGESRKVNSELMRCSTGRKTGQGIGGAWYSKNKNDLKKGFITDNGTKFAVPKYFKRLLDEEDSDRWRTTRIDQESKRVDNLTEQQLATREEGLRLKNARLKRGKVK